MSISTSILAATEKSIQKLFADTNLTSTIVYKLFSGSTFSETLGYTQDVYINLSLIGIRTERKRFSIASPGEIGGIAGVEVNYLIQELPEGYSNRDIIEHNGTNHQIEKIRKIADLAYRIEVQGA
jgi:hypothetical protein